MLQRIKENKKKKMEIIYDDWLYNPYCKICGLTYNNFHHPFKDKHDRLQPIIRPAKSISDTLFKVDIDIDVSCWTQIYIFYTNFFNCIKRKNE